MSIWAWWGEHLPASSAGGVGVSPARILHARERWILTAPHVPEGPLTLRAISPLNGEGWAMNACQVLLRLMFFGALACTSSEFPHLDSLCCLARAWGRASSPPQCKQWAKNQSGTVASIQLRRQQRAIRGFLKLWNFWQLWATQQNCLFWCLSGLDELLQGQAWLLLPLTAHLSYFTCQGVIPTCHSASHLCQGFLLSASWQILKMNNFSAFELVDWL